MQALGRTEKTVWLTLLFSVVLVSCIEGAVEFTDEDLTINITSVGEAFHLVLLIGEEDDSEEFSHEMVSAFQLSVEIMNKNARLASSKFQIKYTILRTKHLCDQNNVDLLINSSVVGIVGSLSKDCSRAAREKLEKSNISLMSFLPAAGQIAEDDSPGVLSVSPRRSKQGQAFAAIVQRFGWKTVGIVEEKSLSSVGPSIQLEMEAQGINVDPIIFVDDRRIDQQIEEIKQSPTRVIVLLVEEASKREKLLKRAYLKGLLDKGWYWLVTETVTVADMKEISSLVPDMQGVVGLSPRGGSGALYHQLLAEWLTKKKTIYPGEIWETKFEEAVGPYVPQVYDAVYAYYGALLSLVEAKAIQKDTTISAKRTALQAELRRNNNQSHAFVGATGERIFFDPQSGDGPPLYDIVNLQGNSWRKVGWYGQEGLTISRLIVWPGGNMNAGYSADAGSKVKTYESLAVVMSIVMCVFLVLTIVLYRMVLAHREKTNQYQMQYILLSKGDETTDAPSCKKSHEDLENDQKKIESIL